jgi:hypothetical protein
MGDSAFQGYADWKTLRQSLQNLAQLIMSLRPRDRKNHGGRFMCFAVPVYGAVTTFVFPFLFTFFLF